MQLLYIFKVFILSNFRNNNNQIYLKFKELEF